MNATWNEAIDRASDLLRTNGVDEARTNAEYMAAAVLGVWAKADLRPLFETQPTESEEKKFWEYTGRRLRDEPLQYIIGETEFFGLRLYCSPAALIPRPETEVLVEEALKEAKNIQKKKGNIRILDIGTGSGAIVLALASQLSDAWCIGIDISNNALALAEQNRSRLALANVEFLNKDFLSDKFDSRYDLIVSNPPYVPQNELSLLPEEVRSFEPLDALTDRSDGFSFYNAIAEQAPVMTANAGVIVVETEFKGASRVAEIFSEHGLKVDRTVQDLLGFDRVIVASL